jgi:hypothetical protein
VIRDFKQKIRINLVKIREIRTSVNPTPFLSGTDIFSAINAKRMRDKLYKYKQNALKLVKWATAMSIVIAIMLALVFAMAFK